MASLGEFFGALLPFRRIYRATITYPGGGSAGPRRHTFARAYMDAAEMWVRAGQGLYGMPASRCSVYVSRSGRVIHYAGPNGTL